MTNLSIPRAMPAQQKQSAYSSVWNRRKKPPLMRPMVDVLWRDRAACAKCLYERGRGQKKDGPLLRAGSDMKDSRFCKADGEEALDLISFVLGRSSCDVGQAHSFEAVAFSKLSHKSLLL